MTDRRTDRQGKFLWTLLTPLKSGKIGSYRTKLKIKKKSLGQPCKESHTVSHSPEAEESWTTIANPWPISSIEQ